MLISPRAANGEMHSLEYSHQSIRPLSGRGSEKPLISTPCTPGGGVPELPNWPFSGGTLGSEYAAAFGLPSQDINAADSRSGTAL